MCFRVKRTGSIATCKSSKCFRDRARLHQRVLSTVGRLEACLKLKKANNMQLYLGFLSFQTGSKRPTVLNTADAPGPAHENFRRFAGRRRSLCV